MTTEGKAALGTLIAIGNGSSPETFTDIAEITNVGEVTEKLEFVEMTHHQSVMRDYIPTLPGVDDISLEMNLLADETTQGFTTSGLRKDIRSKTLRNFTIEFPTGDQCAFSAYVASFTAGPAPIDGGLKAKATLKVSGLITWS